jgi:two-component system LytT family response regulator
LDNSGTKNVITNFRTIIVEDNKMDQRLLTHALEQNCKDIQIIGIANNKESAINMIEKSSPDLVFLDIQLPDGDGFDILNHFVPLNFKLIFVTGHQEYAYQAIKFQAIDFLLKPLNVQELIKAVKSIPHVPVNDKYRTKIEGFRRQILDPEKIVLMDSNGFLVLEPDEIIDIEANGNYTDVHLVENRKLTYCKILREFAEFLRHHKNFIRTHRSFIVNLDHVKSFSRQGIIKMSEDHIAHCGDSFKDEFLSYFQLS